MNGNDLLNLISPIESSKYFDQISFENEAPGFSIKRLYPDNIPFYPAKTNTGKPDHYAMIRLSLKENINENCYRFGADITVFSYSHYHLWLTDGNHPDFPSIVEREKSVSSRRPLDLDYEDESMYFDQYSNIFYCNNKAYTLSEFLELIFQEHVESCKLFSRKRIKRSIFFSMWNSKIKMLQFFNKTLKWLLEGLGRELIDNERIFTGYKEYPEDSMIRKTTDEFQILGYKISKTVMILFSAIIIIIYSIGKIINIAPIFIVSIFSSPFMTIVFSVVSLAALDEILPKILLWLLNFGIRLNNKNIIFKVNL